MTAENGKSLAIRAQPSTAEAWRYLARELGVALEALEYMAYGPNQTSIRFPHLGLRRRPAQSAP